jgi:hypothetical protein
MSLTGEKRKTFPSATLIAINPTRTGLGLKPGVPGDADRKWLEKWQDHSETRKEQKNGEYMARSKIQQDESNLYVE